MVVKNEETLRLSKKDVGLKKYPRRQGLRKSITLIMFILFPAIFFYRVLFHHPSLQIEYFLKVSLKFLSP